MLNRHRNLPPFSRGIDFYGRQDGQIIPITREEFLSQYVKVDDFVLGVSRNGLLRPIYDRHCRMVIVHLRDFSNTPLTAYEAQIIPYNREWFSTANNNEHTSRERPSGSRSSVRQRPN